MGDNDTKLAVRIERLRRLYGLELEAIRAAATLELAVIRLLFLLNGGALVVYLGLVGALTRTASAARSIEWSSGTDAIWTWIAGLILATAATFFAARSRYARRKVNQCEATRAAREFALPDESVTTLPKDVTEADDERSYMETMAKFAAFSSVLVFMLGFWYAFLSIPK